MALSASSKKMIRQTSFNNKELLKDLRRFNKRELHVGIVNVQPYKDTGMTTAQMMDMHENGYVTSADSMIPFRIVPPRPILQIARQRFTKKWQRATAQAITTELKKKKRVLDNAYEKVGDNFVDDVRSIFGFGNGLARNSEATIELKGFDDAMIETDTLLDSIDSKVVKRKDKYK